MHRCVTLYNAAMGGTHAMDIKTKYMIVTEVMLVFKSCESYILFNISCRLL